MSKPPLPNAPPAVHLGYLASRVRALGGTVERDESAVQLVLPKGKVWACDGIHTLRVQWGRGDLPEWKTSAIRDALERIEHGVTECTIRECDICNDY